MNIKLSKELSYVLRHHPEKYDLTPDREGWVSLDDLLRGLHRGRWKGVTKEDIEELNRQSDKKRFEIDGHRIRATYGHSFSKKLRKEKVVPPRLLYHGTTRAAYEKIKTEGLRPMGRQYVHLSTDRDTAIKVGKRRDPRPVILIVDALGAYHKGISFFYGNDTTWMSEDIPPDFLTREERG